VSTFQSLVSAALAHHRAGRLAEAESAFRAALADAPAHAAARHNLAVVLAARGDHAAALVELDSVLGAEPSYAAAHYNRAVALQMLGRPREAMASFSRAAQLEPGHYDAHRALGFLWLAEGERGRSLDHFARTYELRRGEDRCGIADVSLTHASRAKLGHDAAQFRYLSARRRDGVRLELLARGYEDVASELPDGVTRLTDDQLDRLGEDYNAAIHLASAAEIAGPAINPGHRGASVANEYSAGSGAIVVDDLLTPPAVSGIRRYLLESTVWHDFDHIGGFVASYLEDGLACPLLLQIADELRRAWPELLGPHPLSQAWAFKGLDADAAVGAHADDAAVSVNLWLTPAAANLEPERGGLLVCRAPPPPDWEIAGYDADERQITTFLERHRDDCLAVPYRDNRAVVFDARLFHRSDAPRFAPGYENRRINLTLLFG
jgi:hypothetical protein